MRSRSFTNLWAALFIAAASVVASAQAPVFSVAPHIFDPYATGAGVAKWPKTSGEGDSDCQTSFGLRLKKEAPLSTYLSAGAILRGLEGQAVLANDTLGFDISQQSSCTGGSPRFNVIYALPDGTDGLSFVGGCANGTITASTQNANWNRVTFDLQTQANPSIPLGAVIRSVELLTDEPGHYALDNIMFRGVFADKENTAGPVPVCAF